jgi:hypothetical protein
MADDVNEAYERKFCLMNPHLYTEKRGRNNTMSLIITTVLMVQIHKFPAAVHQKEVPSWLQMME